VARLGAVRRHVPASGEPVGTTTLTSATSPSSSAGSAGKTKANRRRLLVAFDTSASRQAAMASSVERLRAIAAEAGDLTLDVACFDQDVEVVYHGPAKAFGAAHAQR